MDRSGALHHLIIRGIDPEFGGTEGSERIHSQWGSGERRGADFGEGDFVMDVLKISREEMERRYRLKAVGFTLEKLARRLKLTQPAVCISIRRGEHIAREEGLDIPGG